MERNLHTNNKMGVTSNHPAITDLATFRLESPALKRSGTPKMKGLGGVMSLGSLSNLNVHAEGLLNDKTVRKDSIYQFNEADLEFVKKLGQGSGGAVTMIFHKPTKTHMARKV